ncbi:MAG: hypothetical protein K2X86_01835 [Cytophagaceae bacterium]|nr:hypothetical protein [Cytophagaceae bacterium]
MKINFIHTVLLLLLISVSCKRNTLVNSIPESQIKDTIVNEVKVVQNNNLQYTPEQLQQMRIDTLKGYYWQALAEMERMLTAKESLSFKRAVFITENAFMNNELDYRNFCGEIDKILTICEFYLKSNSLVNYTYNDIEDVAKNGAIFRVMTDTIKAFTYNNIIHYPFLYDFDDFMGNKDWSKMFVTKLLKTHSGNCHSLPFLYKIVADELGATTYLALAPNHIYLKHRNKQIGWYNTELTSGNFPIDAWLSASGYISLPAIRSGIYMDTLSSKQTITLCVIDLAKGYERKFGIDSNFILACTDIALKYYPNYINALILKGETLKKIFDKAMSKNKAAYPKEVFHIDACKRTYEEMEKAYVTAVKLGYREMPEEMYLDWLSSLEQEKEKYKNKKIGNN